MSVQASYAFEEKRQEFLSFYPRRETFICRLAGQDQWRTWQGPLEDHQILGVIADGGRGILRGCHWGEQTRFAVLDIDAGSPYHNDQFLTELRQKLDSIGLKYSGYQSSESGGWHLYLPFDRWEQSNEVEQQLKRWFKKFGYEIKGGKLEIFPSGNALRLPLQPGFAWLGPTGEIVRRREDMEMNDAIASFISDLNQNAASWADARSCIEQQIAEIDRERQNRLDTQDFEHVFDGGKNAELWQRGRRFWRQGLQRHGDRHDAVLAVGHYLWYGDAAAVVPPLPGARNDQYRALLIGEWLKEKHNGKCRHIREGNWRIVEEQIQRAVAWRKTSHEPPQPYPLTSRLLKRLIGIYKKTGNIYTIEQFAEANLQRKINARERIGESIKQLRDAGQLITVAEVARHAKADWRTVKKNWDLMALALVPNEQNSTNLNSQDLLTCSVGVINLGGSLPLAPSPDSNVGPAAEIESVLISENGFAGSSSAIPEYNLYIEINTDVDFAQNKVCKQQMENLEAIVVVPEIVRPGSSAIANELNRVSMLAHMPRTHKRKTGSRLGTRMSRGLPWAARRFSDTSDRADIPRRMQAVTEQMALSQVGGVLAPIDLAPPFLPCLANEPITCAQRKDQALRVPSEVLTSGPSLRDSQAGRQERAGGLELISKPSVNCFISWLFTLYHSSPVRGPPTRIWLFMRIFNRHDVGSCLTASNGLC